MRAGILALILAAFTALPGFADSMGASPRPQARPPATGAQAGAQTAGQTAAQTGAAPDALRPKARPSAIPVAPVATPATPAQRLTIAASSLRPMPRPRDLRRTAPGAANAVVQTAAVVTPPSTALTRSKKGSVCGDPAIKGEVLAPITARIKGCGVAEPVRVSSLDGVALSAPAIMDCTTATALRRWIDNGLQPALSPKRAVRLQIAGDYACRPRNNVKGAPISEHGRGKAIDIAAIVLADGSKLTVADNWNRTMRKVYKTGCGIFGTTLGPGSDGYHEDHMHFDTAARRGGAYCR